jgi:hypothetical protein
MKKEQAGKCEDYEEKQKADVSFTSEKHGDGTANLVGQIMLRLCLKFSSCQIKVSL